MKTFEKWKWSIIKPSYSADGQKQSYDNAIVRWQTCDNVFPVTMSDGKLIKLINYKNELKMCKTNFYKCAKWGKINIQVYSIVTNNET